MCTGPTTGSTEILRIIYNKLEIVTLDVVKSSYIVTRGQGNIAIASLSIRCADLCESDDQPPDMSCTFPVVSTVVGTCNILVFEKNLLCRGGSGFLIVNNKNPIIFRLFHSPLYHPGSAPSRKHMA